MKINQPTAIGLAVGAVVLAGSIIAWTINSNTIVPPPPITAGTSAPGDGPKPVVIPMSTTPGTSLPTGGGGMTAPSPGGMSPSPGMSPGMPMPSPGR